MSHFIKDLQTSIVRTARQIKSAVAGMHNYDADQAYIEGATDIYDLEYRMRQVEYRRSHFSQNRWMGAGGYRT